MKPPIPSPFGDEGAPIFIIGEQTSCGVSVSFRLSALCSLRKNLKEMVAEPVGAVTIVFVSAILAAILWPTSRSSSPTFWELWTLCFFAFPVLVLVAIAPLSLFESKRQKTVILTSLGVILWEKNKPTEIPWASYMFVLEWTGDVLLSKLGAIIFIPREAFVSPEVAREFVKIARQLHKSRGAAWRDEWNGKTFGADA